MRFAWTAIVGLASAIPFAASAADNATAWATSSASPFAIREGTLSARDRALLSRCGAGEDALLRIARKLVARKLAGQSALDLDELSFQQRIAGEPHVWPRAWLVSGRALDPASTQQKLDAWRRTFRDQGVRRCGVASGVGRDGLEVIAAVALDALADLTPLPTRARPGQWLTVEARMLVPASGARVLVLGPSGAPRSVPTSFDGGRVRARFAPDRRGAFTIQVVADVETGPRPVLEASVFADVEPPEEMPERAAPGESAGDGVADPESALLRMIDALRRSRGLPPLTRDRGLDRLARAHARRMASARTIGHDVGDGDPAARLRNAGLAAQDAGENVAHSASVRLAHRALHASASHRTNLLRLEFDRVGLGVVEDADGSVWVAELFASDAR